MQGEGRNPNVATGDWHLHPECPRSHQERSQTSHLWYLCDHTDIFSSVVQSAIFKCAVTGKSLAESSENLWQSKFPINMHLPPSLAWVHRDNMHSPKHGQIWTKGTAGKEQLWFMWSRDLLTDYTKQRSVRFRQGQLRLGHAVFIRRCSSSAAHRSF